jgi:hypothetical protein
MAAIRLERSRGAALGLVLGHLVMLSRLAKMEEEVVVEVKED